MRFDGSAPILAAAARAEVRRWDGAGSRRWVGKALRLVVAENQATDLGLTLMLQGRGGVAQRER